MGSRVIQARVPDTIYASATPVIKATGLSVSDVMRVVMARIATEQMLPLDFFQPNAETLEAIRDAAEGRTIPTTLEGIRAMILADD